MRARCRLRVDLPPGYVAELLGVEVLPSHERVAPGAVPERTALSKRAGECNVVLLYIAVRDELSDQRVRGELDVAPALEARESFVSWVRRAKSFARHACKAALGRAQGQG